MFREYKKTISKYIWLQFMTLSMAKKIFLLFLILIISLGCSMRNFLYSKIYCPDKIKGNYEIEIPFEYVNGLLLLNVKINDIEGKFLFDSGSTSCISHDFFNKSDFETTSYTKLSDINDVTAKKIMIRAEIKLDDIDISNYKFTVLDNLPFNDCDKIDGILGNEIFSLGYVFFDNEKKVIKITNNQNCFNKQIMEYSKLKLHPSIGNLIIKIKNKKYLIDTGYLNGFILEKYSKRRLKDKEYSHISSVISGINSDKIQESFFYMDEYKIKHEVYLGQVKANPEVNYRLLGCYWFCSNNILIDMNNKRIYIKNIKEKITNPQLNTRKISFYYTSNKVLISALSNEISGLRINDTVRKINNIDFRFVKNDCEFDEKLQFIDYKKTIELEIIRNNQIHIYTIQQPLKIIKYGN